MINYEIFLAIGMFTGIVLALVLIILAARAKLVSSGDVSIEINGEKTIVVPAGGKLLQTLASNNIFLSSACGGGGTCARGTRPRRPGSRCSKPSSKMASPMKWR